ncbi:MAG: phage tail sheath family protein, partial [Methylococcaceae bacterium]
NKLKDRVTLCDLKNTGDFNDDAQTLRDNIGINNLKYGSAYGPWLNSSLPRTVFHRDLTLKRDNAAGAVVSLTSLTTDPAILQILADVVEAQDAADALVDSETSAAGAGKTWLDELKEQTDAYDASADTTLANLVDELQAIYGVLAKMTAGVKDMVDELPAIVTANPGPNQTVDFKLSTDITQYIGSAKLKAEFDILAAHYNFLRNPANGNIELFADDPTTATTDLAKAINLLGYTNAAAFQAITNAGVTAAQTAAADEAASADLAKNAAMKASAALIAFYRFVQTSAAEYEKKLNEGLLNNFGTFKSIVNKATEMLNLLPPSGAIAGVYASVDRDRGVWKAPANVSLNAVISPAVKISEEQQAQYNVDVNAGKSINIIRAFTGKGTLVWGARTLAGNDNEWRYVSVRRFFNFVEESVKKATEQFVFEANDANTWVKVQAMIENFLTVLWRQGALQGVKPEHAFYVSVGLGKTMTPLDILEGRMIIEIGMAAVRPAEFIILKFSHKMAES